MKLSQRFIMTAALAVASLWLASAQAATPNPQVLGIWELDISKSERPPGDPSGPPPKSITRTFKDVGGGKWTHQIVVELADGKKMEQPITTFNTADGATTTISGDSQADSMTITYRDSSTAIATFLKNGKPVEKQVDKLSADGKQLLEEVQTTDKDGKPVHYTAVWNKK
jgi:hypothetical protein